MDSKLQTIKALIPIWKKNPVTFVKDVFGVTNIEDWQKEFMMSVVKNNNIAVRSGHGVGKTCALAWLSLWFLITHYPVKVACVASSFGQLETALWPEIGKWHMKMLPPIRELIEVTGQKAYLIANPKESFIVARAASKDRPEALQGIHSENAIFIIDEASGVDDIVFETARGSMSSKGAKTILTGNPTRATGYFFEAFNVQPEHWKLFKVSCFDSTRVNSDEYSDSIVKTYGKDSNVYRVRVLGEFPVHDEDCIIARESIEEAVARNDIDPVNGPVIWGLDVARTGGDRCALAKRRANKLLQHVDAWVSHDTMQTANKVVDIYNTTPDDEKPDHIYVDVIGIGAGVVDRLNELGFPVVGVNVAESPSAKERYNKLRDELWFRCKEWFESREALMPRDDTLIAELVNIKFDFTPSSKIKVEDKKSMKKRFKRSPDLADAFVLTFMHNSNFIDMNADWKSKFNNVDYSWTT